MANNENCSEKSNGEVQKVNGIESNEQTSSLLPHLETIDRLLSLPVCSIAWSQSQGVYEKVKGQTSYVVLKIKCVRHNYVT
jgi:hypothetical protein